MKGSSFTSIYLLFTIRNSFIVLERGSLYFGLLWRVFTTLRIKSFFLRRKRFLYFDRIFTTSETDNVSRTSVSGCFGKSKKPMFSTKLWFYLAGFIPGRGGKVSCFSEPDLLSSFFNYSLLMADFIMGSSSFFTCLFLLKLPKLGMLCKEEELSRSSGNSKEISPDLLRL